MPQTGFELECDRLSSVVDNALFERLRWERNVGPVLARLVALAHAALEKRSERSRKMAASSVGPSKPEFQL